MWSGNRRLKEFETEERAPRGMFEICFINHLAYPDHSGGLECGRCTCY